MRFPFLTKTGFLFPKCCLRGLLKEGEAGGRGAGRGKGGAGAPGVQKSERNFEKLHKLKMKSMWPGTAGGGAGTAGGAGTVLHSVGSAHPVHQSRVNIQTLDFIELW